MTPQRIIGLAIATAALVLGTATASFGDSTQLTGAIFTSNSDCSATNQNIYDSRLDVYLNGGPAHPGAAGLPDGYYYVKVTDPSGTPLLGTSISDGSIVDPTTNPDANNVSVQTSNKPVHVTSGDFDACYQLWQLVYAASDSTQGFDKTTNPGGEYKVWVSDRSDFDNSKTDNFKVEDVVVDPPPPPPQSTLHVTKYYDANTNGQQDLGENEISGWQVNLAGDPNNPYLTPHDFVVTPGTYTVSEGTATQANWLHTTSGSVTITVADGDVSNIKFGNVCTGAGGGLTLGFWSNKNGQALVNASDLSFLTGLYLRNANASNYDPPTAKSLSSWLLAATATNMANMLSAQLATMELNVRHGFVNGNALIYAPGATSANSNGFATVNNVMSEANTDLGIHPNTKLTGATRTYQEALKTALDKANNNLNFAQSSPCAFTF
jgi:hypothetical protein